jgi:hypothetical protein
MQNHELFREAIAILSAPRVRDLLGLQATASAYRLARDPNDDDGEGGTGARNPVDRMDALQDALASYPEGRALLVRWKVTEDAKHARRAGAGHVRRYSPEAVLREVEDVTREFADVVRECGKGVVPNGLCAQRIKREAAELIAELHDLIHAADAWEAQAADSRIEPNPRNLRAG